MRLQASERLMHHNSGNLIRNMEVIRNCNMLSNKDFATILNIPYKRISEIMKGRLLPTNDNVKALINYCGYTKEQLINDNFSLQIVISADIATMPEQGEK